MRVLIADKLVETARARLEGEGCDVHVEPKWVGEVLAEGIARVRPHVLVVRSTRVTDDHLRASSSLSLVIRAGAGVNTIDLAAAGRRGVFVANCPGRNAAAVAELTLGLLVALDRRIPDNVADARAGVWNKGRYGAASGLRGRTLGVLGTGRIGAEVIRRAQAFDMRVVAWSRSLTPERADSMGIDFAATPLDVARRCDALSVHLAQTDETRGIVDAEVLDAIGPGGVLVNTSRAGLVDEVALLTALENTGLRVALDVFADEPKGKDGRFSSPLASHPQVYVTHHIGASTDEAQEAVAAEVCRIVEHFRSTGQVDNCVNLELESRAEAMIVVRHLDRVGALAGVLDVLREAGVNVAEMENRRFHGGVSAIAHVYVDRAPARELIGALEGRQDVLHAECVRIERGGPS